MGVQSIDAYCRRDCRVPEAGEGGWNDAAREAFIDWIAANPEVGDVIPGADGARKVRWSRDGMGKRGGVRVIYFYVADDEIVLLLMVYAKAVRSTVKAKNIKRGSKT